VDLRGLGRVVARPRAGDRFLDQLGRHRAPALGPALADQRIAHRPQEIADLVLAA
jgi:hypothetical protein